MRKLIDLTGKKFTRLTVLSRAANNGKAIAWNCLCDCGSTKIAHGDNLKSGATKSCGCLQKELASRRSEVLLTTHGLCGTPTYRTWKSMKQRCLNPKTPNYKNYGGRGIGICKRWLKFENFLADMGERPAGKTIDRIDNDKNYCKENCKWATFKEQALNRRSSVRLAFKGKTLCITEWAEKLKVKPYILYNRLRRGWSIERTLADTS